MNIEIAKCWLWAAMHHKDFSKCIVKLHKPLISIRSSFCSPYRGTLATICLDFCSPKLSLDIPYGIVSDYQDAMKELGIIVKVGLIDDIPF